MDTSSPTDKPGLRELAAVAIISAAVLGLELALMRTLAISRWHHFAYLVVGLALLGFGASGTWLGLLTPRLLPHFSPWVRGLTLILAVSITLCYRSAESLPLQMRYVLFSGQQLFYLTCYQALIFLPFLVAGILIGFTLIRFAPSVNLVYGANLLGSGTGPILAVGLMMWLPPARLIQGAAFLVWTSVFLWPPAPGRRSARRFAGISVLVGLLIVAEAIFLPVPMRTDPHKMLAELQRWQKQGDARHLVTRHGPRARLDVFTSPRLHHTLFAGLTATTPPPSQSLLLADGESAGPMLHIDNPAGASILEHTPMSVAYRLLPNARVLLLGETSGVNVWLARRYGASKITLVVENPQMLDVLLGPLDHIGDRGLKGEDLEVHSASPRHFLEYSEDRFDIIHVVGAEGMAAGVSSLLSLHENYLLTVEGMVRCLEHLTPRGLITITRGLQSPPRDNVKILATLVAALEGIGVQRPDTHLAQLRNHLAVCTLGAGKPFEPIRVQQVVQISDLLWLDIDTLPGFDPHSREPFNRLMGSTGENGSFYRMAAGEIFSPNRERFFKDWAYNVRPATDDRPYFFDFFRWRSLPRFIRSHGHYWFQRLELGYVVLVISLVQIVAAAVVLLLLPLFLWARHRRSPSGGGWAFVYFLLLGFAFLALEISLMQRFTLLMGDPLLAAAGVLSGFLFFAGLGSIYAQRWTHKPAWAIFLAGLGIALSAPLVFLLSKWLLGPVSTWTTASRFVVLLILLAPLAFLMGWPFPAGMRLLERWSPGLMPWAWGLNGFASVAAAPLTVLLAMSLGFQAVLALAVGSYLLATVLAFRVWGSVS
ncbi:MAG: hypothetical protein JSU72_00940 [Deltaproteobacteria bacterium]|nr:MAG: hypothetical protein JSU72_00940 [Deltaproteobacteria bacterium]